jgi:hypothetical protein
MGKTKWLRLSLAGVGLSLFVVSYQNCATQSAMTPVPIMSKGEEPIPTLGFVTTQNAADLKLANTGPISGMTAAANTLGACRSVALENVGGQATGTLNVTVFPADRFVIDDTCLPAGVASCKFTVVQPGSQCMVGVRLASQQAAAGVSGYIEVLDQNSQNSEAVNLSGSVTANNSSTTGSGSGTGIPSTNPTPPPAPTPAPVAAPAPAPTPACASNAGSSCQKTEWKNQAGCETDSICVSFRGIYYNSPGGCTASAGSFIEDSSLHCTYVGNGTYDPFKNVPNGSCFNSSAAGYSGENTWTRIVPASGCTSLQRANSPGVIGCDGSCQ